MKEQEKKRKLNSVTITVKDGKLITRVTEQIKGE